MGGHWKSQNSPVWADHGPETWHPTGRDLEAQNYVDLPSHILGMEGEN